jgi:uncharacterized membrane protein YccC
VAQTIPDTSRQTRIRRLPPPSPAVQHGLRYGTAAAGALWLAYAANLPEPTWPLITVMMVAQPTAGGSLQKGMLRIFGTVAAGFAAVALYGLFAQAHLLLAASMCVVYALATYGMTGPRHGYAWNVFGFTTGIILADAMPGTNFVEILAFDRVSLVLLGLLASFAASAVFWPVRAEDQLRASLAARARQIVVAARLDTESSSGSASPAAASAARPPSALIAQLGLLDQLRGNMGVTDGRVRAFAQVMFGLDALDTILRTIPAVGPRQQNETPRSPIRSMGRLVDLATAALDAAADALAAGQAPAPYDEALQRELAEFDDARITSLTELIDGTPDETRAVSEDARRAAAFASRQAPVFCSMVSLLGEIEAALSAIAREDDPARPAAEPRREVGSNRFAPDPLRLEQALRAGIAVASAFVLIPLLGWQVNSTHLTLAYMVAAAPTRGARTATAVGLGIAAITAWLISDLSIIYIAPHLGRMPLALIYPLLLAGSAGYLLVRFPKLAPIAPITAMIPIIGVFGGGRAPNNIEGPYDTTIVLFSGILIGVLAQRLLWPRTATELFLRRIAGQLDLCLQVLRWAPEPGDELARRRMVAQVMTGYEQQLTMLTQLHGQAQQEPVEQGLDDEQRTHLLTAVAEVFEVTLHRASVASDEAGDRLVAGHASLEPLFSAIGRQDAAVHRSIEVAARALKGESHWEETGLREAQADVESCVEDVRGMGGLAGALGGREADALIAYVDWKRRLASQSLVVDGWLRDRPGRG